MKPKFICDSCKEKLKKQMKEEDMTIFILDDNIGGFSLLEHNNCPNKVVICGECEEEAREQLKDSEDWTSLELWDSHGSCEDFYDDFDKLKNRIEELSKIK
jgi:hypothetical protein